MSREELTLDDKGWMDEVLLPLGDGLSEYSFANLYLFREVHQYRIIRGEFPFIEGRTYDGFRHLMPLFDPGKVDRNVLTEMLIEYDFIFPVSATDFERLNQETFKAWHIEADSDYLYSAKKLETFSGKKLRNKRNQRDQFLRLDKTSSHPLTSGLEIDALRVLDKWQAACGKLKTQTDYHQCQEALIHLEALGLFGFIHYVGEEPAGYILGEPLGESDCVIHFAKGLKEHSGIYPYMFNHFVNSQRGRYLRYNFEQDLGIANFKKSKLSYDPDCLLHKHRVTLKN